MNQEENIPARVTRGALRRRSVDQEATPQKSSATVANGTPKKTNSTTKRVNALNPIQEREGRPSTPIAGRSGRRRMSETIDTPATLPNKLVQNLKETEVSSESGKRSRNISLTEENLNELNVGYEGSGTMLLTRSRTPARVRASHESLVTSGSPLSVTPGLRRSTRRNSVTSDDGNISVQSLPITTPKTSSGLRALKDDTIIEEDASDDRAESVSSDIPTRHMRSQSALSHVSASASPRSATASPVLVVRNESTPPRAVASPLSLSKMSPRSKNISFSDDSKRDDNQSSFPKTPTSVSKEVFIMVADLRNSELKGVTPKVDAVIDMSPKKIETGKDVEAVHSSPKCENIERGNETLNESILDTIKENTDASLSVQNEQSIAEKSDDKDVSGIDVLETSVKEPVDTKAEDNQKANDSLREENKFPKSWAPPLRRSASQAIDQYTVPKTEEQEWLEESKESLPKAQKDSSLKASSPEAEEQSAEESEDKEEDNTERNEFIDDEALEVEDYQSCDSLDEELKREIEENQIPDQGEDLGSEDTEEHDDDDEYTNDSWLVAEDNEMDEERLLRSSNEDLTTSDSPKQTTLRKRKMCILDDSEENDEKEISFGKKSSPLKSPKRTPSIKRSVTPVAELQNNDNETVETNVVVGLAKSPTPATPPKKATSNSPVKISSNQKQRHELVKAAAPAKEDETIDSSVVIFEDANETKEDGQQKAKETENSALLSTSPKKSNVTRNSLPAGVVHLPESRVVADVRKSLPASAKIQSYGKTDDDEVEKIPEIDKNELMEEVIDLEENTDDETSFQGNQEQNELPSMQFTLEQPVKEASNPDRKYMPPVSLISAQFYIGGTKKRNTVGGGESNMLTSTPKPNESSAVTKQKSKPKAEKKNSNGSNSIVPNPFALANGAKLKSRVSLETGASIKQDAKIPRLSLPAKLIQEDLPSRTETAKNGSQEPEPEPMEVDEEIEEDVVNGEVTKQNDDEDKDDDDVSVEEVQPEEGQRPKMVKPKPKALEDYYLTIILVRCNEVMREDKERKKQLASVLRKKKEEKKRLRELEKQEELETAKNAANTTTDNDGDPNNVNASTGNESAGLGEEPTKKKKKRKPKVKNYLLDELAETRKERLEQALRHKLEVIERRKQRKKYRQHEKRKLLDKENEDGASATGGIGAKLAKMKKKQKAKTSNEAKAVTENTSKDPPVRVNLSAYAVFNELQTNQTPSSASIASVDGKQKESADKGQLVFSPVEKKQLLKKSNRKEKHATAEHDGKADKNPSDKQLASSTVPKTLSADDAAGCMKQHTLDVNDKKNAPLLQSASDGLKEDPDKMSKKQKKKQTISSASEGMENVQPNALSGAHKISADRVVKQVESKVTAKTEQYSNDEKPKEKKTKKELVIELILNETDSDVKKQKRDKKIKLNGVSEDHDKIAHTKPSSAIAALNRDDEQLRKIKKQKKKLAPQTENNAMEEGYMTELSGKKSTSVEMEPTTPVPSIAPAKKRKREQQGDSSAATTPRPAKHTKLRVLQRIESGGFFVENVTPDKVRLKRNFGFQERPATPAKQLGFKVSSLLPTGQEELRGIASSSKMYSKDGRKKSKFGDVVGPERNMSLPLPVWTSSGVFFESTADGNGVDSNKKTQSDKSGNVQLKSQGKGEFNIKALRPGPIAEKPHRVDPAITNKSVLNFKRQQLLEKTAHLRDKKKSQRM
ncbi:protein slender lobes-like [Anopheles moucheti]|uniref:protein slender lobes-like n=1 Tax=Anopheles moucheti TaxID=186751 RepID=UPI0022F088DA|nr:protein slender lobes-like [Anopheles moucheti]